MLIAAFTSPSSELSISVGAGSRREPNGDWHSTLDTQGVRTIWFARAPDARSGNSSSTSGADDGQELTNLVISNDDSHVVYVRGGDHDANWTVPLHPDPRLCRRSRDGGLVSFDKRWWSSAAR